MIERALFALDCGIHPMFNLALGTTRLPFQYFENRCFYLAIWHHMESLGRRGCWRTALEFNKLLFAYILLCVSLISEWNLKKIHMELFWQSTFQL
jgi:hypothetical protein